MAKVSGSALEAMKMGYLLPSDQIVMNVHELLSQACEQVRSMSAAGYTAPLMKKIPVGGSSLIATITGQLVNLKDGRFISEHDYFIAHKIISVIAGGEVDAGTLVTEDWLLKLERQAFVELLGTQKTQERIMGLLQTGKPLRN
jgi:3-hydroxyacyl-CoA dehydrogenase